MVTHLSDLIGWKKFRPDEKRVDFIKRCFSGKVNPLLLLFSFALTFGLSILTVYIAALIEGNPFRSDRRRTGVAWIFEGGVSQKVSFSQICCLSGTGMVFLAYAIVGGRFGFYRLECEYLYHGQHRDSCMHDHLDEYYFRAPQQFALLYVHAFWV